METTFFISVAAFFTCLILSLTNDLYAVPFFFLMLMSVCVIAITIYFGVEERDKRERESREGGSNE